MHCNSPCGNVMVSIGCLLHPMGKCQLLKNFLGHGDTTSPVCLLGAGLCGTVTMDQVQVVCITEATAAVETSPFLSPSALLPCSTHCPISYLYLTGLADIHSLLAYEADHWPVEASPFALTFCNSQKVPRTTKMFILAGLGTYKSAP